MTFMFNNSKFVHIKKCSYYSMVDYFSSRWCQKKFETNKANSCYYKSLDAPMYLMIPAYKLRWL